MSQSVPVQTLNQNFIQKIASESDRHKVASEAESYIRDRLRETAFCRSLLEVKNVMPSECQRSENHDTLVKIVEVEPRSRAMSMTFGGQPQARYFYGERLAVGFYTITSEKLQKTEQELLAYQMPITQILEDNSVKDLMDIEDREYLIHTEAACQALQTEANGGTSTALTGSAALAGTVVQYSIIKGELAMNSGVDNTVVHPVQRPDLFRLKTIIDSRRLRTECMLITDADMNGVGQWTAQDFGAELQSETAVDGYKRNVLAGMRLVRTIKTDILKRGNIYSFAAPKFFGKMFILNNPKFWIDKQVNLISFQCWEDIGMVIGNIAACAKLETYAADANPTTQASAATLAALTPVEEDQIGALNNRVSSGLNFPKIYVA